MKIRIQNTLFIPLQKNYIVNSHIKSNNNHIINQTTTAILTTGNDDHIIHQATTNHKLLWLWHQQSTSPTPSNPHNWQWQSHHSSNHHQSQIIMVVASTINQSQQSLQLAMSLSVNDIHWSKITGLQLATTVLTTENNSDINNPTTVQDPPVTTNLHLASIHHCNPTRSTSYNKPYIQYLYTTATLLNHQ